MELAVAYAALTLKKEEKREEKLLHELIGDPRWLPFHESTEKKISVFAGRRTRKTYQLALMIDRSGLNCEVYVGSEAGVLRMAQELQQLRDYDRAQVEQRSAQLRESSGKVVTIRILPSSNAEMFNPSWFVKDIFVDEFEDTRFETLMTVMEREIERANRIVCVGSINTSIDTYAKRWFKSSDKWYYIDTDNIPPTRGHMPEEYRPSLMKNFIDHLPPLGYSFL